MSNTNSRLEKLEKESNPYPRDFPGRVPILTPVQDFEISQHLKLKTALTYKIAGRVIARRNHGYNIFFDLMDQTGEIQLHVKYNVNESPIKDLIDRQAELKKSTGFGGTILISPPPYWTSAQECDLGDMVGVEGQLATNPRGEPLFIVSNWTTLAKALREPPDKQNGLKSPEMKYRHRELDLMSSAESRELFKTRARLVAEIRKYLNDKDFIEIECPVLQPIYGGATARPFVTRHNTLGQDYFLAISSELYLKRALVGGFDRVYSFSRCFRNEGISPTHQPEFTNLEIFETCKTADDMEVLVQDLISHLCVFTSYKGIKNLISKWGNPNFNRSMPAKDWPLSRISEDDIAEAWELFINDMEIASGASDLNDPREQEVRLRKSEKKSNEYTETQYSIDSYNEANELQDNDALYDPYDQNYIEALEQGALPWAGVGIGIDRLMMLLTGKKNIRDVIMFPLLKKENK